jgi:hypothetical protein
MKTIFLRTIFCTNLLVSAVAAPAGFHTVFSSAEGYQPGGLPAGGGWRFVGTAPAIVSNPGSPGGQALSIPSDTQLIRGVDAGGKAVVVSLLLKPSFGSAATGPSVVEFGPISILFLGNGDTGRVSCLVGSSGVVTSVADSIPLDGQSRSECVLTVQVGLDAARSTATLSVGAETATVDLRNDNAQRSALELVISAGATGSVQVESLEIAPPAATATDPNAGDLGKAGGDRSNPTAGAGASSGKSEASPFGAVPSSLASSKAAATATPTAKSAKVSSLEIFTPGSRLTAQSDTSATASSSK